MKRQRQASKNKKFACNTNPKKLLYESPHPGLLPLEKVTMRTYWDWYNFPAFYGLIFSGAS